MKVGDYVRTRDGIAKIGKIRNGVIILDVELDLTVEGFGNQYLKEDIIKSSPNIIDLIKEGDLVNNHIVGQVFYENQTIDNIKYLDLEGVNILVCNDDIKSIVTREMFESMQYKVGD